MLNLDAIVTRAASVLSAETDGEVVALEVGAGGVFGFNGTASKVWLLIETPRSVREICGAMMAAYDVDALTCEREVMALLESLSAQGLVEVGAPAPA